MCYYIILLFLFFPIWSIFCSSPFSFSSLPSSSSSILLQSSSSIPPSFLSSSSLSLSSLPSLPLSCSHLFSSSVHLFLSFKVYVSALGYTYLYSSSLSTIRPRMFYRSGWLRCVGLKYVGIVLDVLSFLVWAGERIWHKVFVLLLYYTYTIIIYLILYYTLPFFCSSSLPPLPNYLPFPSHLSPVLFFLLPNLPSTSFKVYVSALPFQYS